MFSGNPMLKIVLNNLFKKPATRNYPVTKREFFPATRGKILINQEQCIYCGLCQRRCPAGAIQVNRNEKSWCLDPLRCVTCNFCVEVCPKKCLLMDNHYTDPIAQPQGGVCTSTR